MRNYTKINEKEIQINALFLQPVSYCELNCKGCYLKQQEINLIHNSPNPIMDIGKTIHIDKEFWYILTKEFARTNGKLNSNQITFALNTLPRNPTTFTHVYNPRKRMDEFIELNKYMNDVFYSFMLGSAYAKLHFNTQTEFHVTTYSYLTLLSYFTDHNTTAYMQDCLKASKIDMITFSSLVGLTEPVIDFFHDLGIKINLNFQSSPKWDAINVNILKRVDYIYLLLTKPDLGESISPEAQRLFDRMVSEFQSLSFFKDKVTIDGCIKDAQQYAMNGRGCSSNISRFQIMSDGSISGCPYSHKPTVHGPQFSKRLDVFEPSVGLSLLVEQVLEKIRKTHEEYDFKRCKIPELFPDQPYIETMKNKSLYILED